MLQLRSQLQVADNSGAKLAYIIAVAKKGNLLIAKLGDTITVGIKKADPNGQIKTHQVTKAVIVRTRKEFRRQDGSYIRFDENACVILEENTNNPKGTRIFGPIAREIKQLGFNKIASLAKEIY
jgi:large subunit ribosomal protein L14